MDLKEVHDKFRGVEGAFDMALNGIRNCIAADIKVGLRFTINKRNAEDIPGIFDLIERENIPRVCFLSSRLLRKRFPVNRRGSLS